MTWLPTSERLPEAGKRVLVATQKDKQMTGAEFKAKTQEAYERNPVMAIMWYQCLQWTMSETGALKQFEQETGHQFPAPAKCALDAMVDEACGMDKVKEETFIHFIDWFNANVWGFAPWDEIPPDPEES